MATRMLQRRGTAAQWTSANPVLAAGEIGVETDTGQFKIGDGVTAWTSVPYFKDTLDLGIADKAPSDSPTFTGTVVLPSTTSIGNVSATEISYVDGVTSAIQTQLNAKAPTANPTFTGTVSGITKSMVGLGNADNTTDANKPVSSATQTALDLKAPLADPTFTGTVVLPSTTSIGNVSATEIGYVDGVTSAIQTQLDAKAALAGATFTGTVAVSDTTQASSASTGSVTTAGGIGVAKNAYVGGNLNVAGNLTISGTTTTVSSTNLEVTDPLIYIGTGNSANVNDLGLVGHFDNGTYQHTGLVRDASDGKWKLFSGITTEPTTTIDFGTWTKDTLVAGGIETANLTATGSIDFTGATVTGLTTLPSQTGNSGKYLTTNGSVASWATLNASPALDDLSDVTITSATTNDVVYFNGTTWINKYVQAIPTVTNAQSGTTYTLVLGDAGKIVEVSNASAITLTIPTNASVAYPVGTQITILQTGAGQITVAAPSGGTLNATPGTKLRAQWSSATLLKRATDTWVLMGDLTA